MVVPMVTTFPIPPHNLDAERAVLGAVLLEGRETLPRLAEMLQTSDFFLEAHRVVFDTMQRLGDRGEPVDLITLSEALRRAGQLEAVGGPALLALLVEQASLSTLLTSYIDILVDAAVRREALQAAARLATNANNGAGSTALLAELAATTEALQRRRRGAFPLPIPLPTFATTPPIEPVWLVEHLLLAGTSGWLGAGAKVGKSYLALDLLLACALGEPWLGQFSVPRPLTVVLIEEEDSAWRIYSRLQHLIAGRGLEAWPATFHVSIRRGLRIDAPATFDPLARWLAAVHPDLVCWDVFNLLHSQDERRPDQIMPVLWKLDTLRNDIGCSNLVLHHQRKPAAGAPDTASGGQKLRGPSEFWGWAENSLYLSPLKGKGALIVEPESKDALVEPFKVHLEDRPDGSRAWIYDGALAAKVSRGDEVRQRIVRVLQEQITAMSRGDLAKAVGLRDRQVSAHLGALHEAGAIEWLPDPESRGGRGRLWRVAPEESDHPDSTAAPGF